MIRKQKLAVLRDDEFRPLSSAYPGGFWQLPRSIAAIPDKLLCGGAKMLYADLSTRAQQTGTTWASTDTLQDDLGGISKRTLYRWTQQLVKLKMIRVHQKGRGLPNNYYILKSPWIAEFDADLIEAQRIHHDWAKREAKRELLAAMQQESYVDPEVLARWEEKKKAQDEQMRQWQEEWAKEEATSNGPLPSSGDVLAGQESVVDPSA